MRVLLLGITGNIGSRLAPAFIAHGHSIVVFIRPASKGKIPSALVSQLEALVEGDAKNPADIKKAIIEFKCDTVFNAAGLAAMTRFQTPSDLPAIFRAVVDAATAARRERGAGSPPIRLWMMSGWSLLDNPSLPGHLIRDSLPLFPEHKPNWQLIEKTNHEDIAWSLFCCAAVTGKYEPAKITPPPECKATNLVAGADEPVAWKKNQWVAKIPLVGNLLNLILQAGNYSASIEDCADWLAEDLDRGLTSEWIGHRVCLKLKENA